MIFLKLILTTSVIFPRVLHTICEYLEEDSEPVKTHRLPRYILPITHYILIHQETSYTFTGHCHILIRIDRPTHDIYLHAQEPQVVVTSSVLNKINSLGTFVPEESKYSYTSHILKFHFSDELSIGQYTLEVKYNLSLDDEGKGLLQTFYINNLGNKASVIATGLQASGARKIFPCWDELTFRQTFHITVHHFPQFRVLSNIPIRYIKENTKHNISIQHTLTSFEETPRTSAPFIGFILIHLDDFSCSNFTERNLAWCWQSHLSKFFSANISRNVMQHLTTRWKYFETISKVDTVVIPGFPHNSAESIGLIFYREAAINYDEKSDPIMSKINVGRTVTHAVTYQWLTKLIHPNRWSDAWINQGLSVLIAADIMNKIYPESRMMDLFVVQIQQESLRLDVDSIMKPLTSQANSPFEISSLFSFSYYLKAPAILRMLQYALTSEVFWNGFQKLLYMPMYDANNFWFVMGIALDECSNVHRFDVHEVMDPWTKLEHYPVIEVTRNHTPIVTVSLYNYDLSDQKILSIPITWRTYNNSSYPYNFAWFNPSLLEEEFTTYIPEVNHVINFQQTGYYRVKYNVENWKEIAKYLDESYENIHVLNRAQIIDDAFYFLTHRQLNWSEFHLLTEYLQKESDYIAWYPMIKALEYMSPYFPFSDSVYIKEHLQHILSKVLNRIGYTEKAEDSDLLKCLRQEVAKWACILDDMSCKLIAFVKLHIHLENPINNNILPWWKKWTYCNALRMPNSTLTWMSVFHKWINNTADNELLEFLSCSQIPSIIHKYLNVLVNTSGVCLLDVPRCEERNIQDKKRIYNFLLTVARNAGNSEILQYMLNNLKKIKPREVSEIAMISVIINHVYSRETLSQVSEFLTNNELNVEFIRVSKLQFNPTSFNQDKVLEYERKEIRNCIKSSIERMSRHMVSYILDKIDRRTIEIGRHIIYYFKITKYKYIEK